MKLEENWVASKYVLLVLAVVGLRACACHLLVVMLSIATSPTDHLGFALSLLNPVIALDAISSLYIHISL